MNGWRVDDTQDQRCDLDARERYVRVERYRHAALGYPKSRIERQKGRIIKLQPDRIVAVGDYKRQPVEETRRILESNLRATRDEVPDRWSNAYGNRSEQKQVAGVRSTGAAVNAQSTGLQDALHAWGIHSVSETGRNGLCGFTSDRIVRNREVARTNSTTWLTAGDRDIVEFKSDRVVSIADGDRLSVGDTRSVVESQFDRPAEGLIRVEGLGQANALIDAQVVRIVIATVVGRTGRKRLTIFGTSANLDLIRSNEDLASAARDRRKGRIGWSVGNRLSSFSKSDDEIIEIESLEVVVLRSGRRVQSPENILGEIISIAKAIDGKRTGIAYGYSGQIDRVGVSTERGKGIE